MDSSLSGSANKMAEAEGTKTPKVNQRMVKVSSTRPGLAVPVDTQSLTTINEESQYSEIPFGTQDSIVSNSDDLPVVKIAPKLSFFKNGNSNSAYKSASKKKTLNIDMAANQASNTHSARHDANNDNLDFRFGDDSEEPESLRQSA